MGESQVSPDDSRFTRDDWAASGYSILPRGNVIDKAGRVIGFISPLSVIGQPPEHRMYRWRILEGQFHPLEPYIHPTAIVEALVTIDAGINLSTFIGPRTILMKHSHVGHDAWIGESCNIAPGAIIGGHCRIGNFVKVGLGASIRPRVTIGNNAVIGAGAVVVKDIPSGEVWAGNPAKNIHPKQTDEDIWMEWYDSWHPRNKEA